MLFISRYSSQSRLFSVLPIISFVFALSILFPKSEAQTQVPTQPPSQVPLQAPSGLDDSLKHFQPGQEPVVVPPISFVDVNSGRFGKLEIDLVDGQFQDAAVDKLHLIAKDLDVQDGVLKSLDIAVHGGHLHDFTFDELNLTTAGALQFDPGILLNHRMLQFSQPAQAQVSATISQASLNRFLSSPKTLEHLSVSAGKRANAIASLIGISTGNIGLNVNSAQLIIGKNNKLTIDIQANLGLGLGQTNANGAGQNQIGLPIPAQIQASLGLKDGWLDLSDAHLFTAGQEIPNDLTTSLLKKINGISLSTQHSDDIRFSFTDLKVVPNKQIQLKGTAQITRLRFSNQR